MKCRISFIALVSVLSLANAVSLDYYPHDPHAHPAHVKYIEPNHIKPIKYFQSAPTVPHYKHIPAAPVKYIQPEHHAVKYIHPEPHPVKYIENPHYAKHVEYDEPVHYEFGYDVHDPHTGDVKSHSEKRDGHSVQGRYEILDPDGFKRIVEYTADDHNGFNAVVRREPTDVKIIKKVFEPEVVKTIAPIPSAPIKYFTPQSDIISATPKYYAAPHHQKIIAPIVKQYAATPQYYAPPEHPKYFKPAFTKFAKPSFDYDPHHTAVKYVTPSPHYNHY